MCQHRCNLSAHLSGEIMIQPQSFFQLERTEKKLQILNMADVSEYDDEINRSKKICGVINSFIDDYFDIALDEDAMRSEGSALLPKNLGTLINQEINKFKPLAIEALKRSAPTREEIILNPNNVYQLSGATKLSAANTATRNLSTTMGLLWERIANVSPYAINPESEFNIKVKGIDLISRNIKNNYIEYQQVKTQRNTLTGSQKGRSIEELSLHANPVFCACFALGSWTFNHSEIPRVAGEQFWGRIGIDYKIFEENVKLLMLDLEETFINL